VVGYVTDDTHVAVVTGEKRPELTADGQSLMVALRERGFDATPAVWSDPDVEWTDFDVALLRSCWDYHEAIDAFRELIADLEAAGVTLRNPAEVIRWNVHKTYLRDLADAGVPTLETAWVEASDEADVDLEALLRDRGWEQAVVKPAVGTRAVGTWRTSIDEASEHQDRFDARRESGDVLVQAFAPEIRDGERSLVFFGGEFSHASNAVPAPDDFRSHHSFGGTNEPYDPPRSIVEQGREIVRRASDVHGIDPVALPYARVDGIERDGEFRLIELELIEPFLGLERADGAVDRFADAIERSLRLESTAVGAEDS
jgi:glutathione synthase/RimK-type ligase-like ATP-grasp enzyme